MISWQFPKFMVKMINMINNTQLDDADIDPEIKNLFCRCNVLTRRFCSSSVSVTVKRVLFESFCLCTYMYDVMAQWTNFTGKSYKRMTMKACYVKCLKNFWI